MDVYVCIHDLSGKSCYSSKAIYALKFCLDTNIYIYIRTYILHMCNIDNYDDAHHVHTHTSISNTSAHKRTRITKPFGFELVGKETDPSCFPFKNVWISYEVFS